MSILLRNRYADLGRAALSYTVFSETMLLETIGDDLRDLYGDVGASSQPTELIRLAAMIDEQRGEADGSEP